jgi:hypothetical protein
VELGVLVHTVIPALGKLKQEDCDLEPMGHIAKPCLKKKKVSISCMGAGNVFVFFPFLSTFILLY